VDSEKLKSDITNYMKIFMHIYEPLEPLYDRYNRDDGAEKMKIKEYLKMLRVKEWIKFYTLIPLIGALLARATPSVLISVGVIFFCVIGYGFVINNYFDVEIDKRHTKKVMLGKNPLSTGKVSKKGTFMLMSVLLAIPVALSCFLSPNGLLFTLLSISLLTLYSIKYIRLKERFIVDIISHGMMFGLFPFLAGFTLAGGDVNTLTLLIASLFMIIGSVSLFTHQINDYDEDFGNSSTTVVRVGLKSGWALLLFFVLLAIADLELIAHCSDIGVMLHSGAFAYLIAYPLYTCRGGSKVLSIFIPALNEE
jgi:4-hydroxybenzoate polyprenyltransferase